MFIVQQKQLPEKFYKKLFLKIPQNSLETTCVKDSVFNKVAG